MKVAIQGERGCFSHEAALHLVPKCQVVSCARSREVFDRLQRGNVAAAVIPIENSLAGSVLEHFDLLLSHDVFVQREYRLRINHHLIAAPGVKVKDLRRVLSHPVALDQCRDFFRKHPHIRPEPFYDTAGSVKHVVEEDLRDAAGIGPKQAATEYKGHILQSDLEDDRQNFTRFFLVLRKRRILPRANKASIAFSLKNTPGALFKALSVFALRDLNLIKIESRPVRGKPWEYVFYVDIVGEDAAARERGLRHLEEVAEWVKVLGVYPQAK
ncbi:MAG TPA: prephenate dehydratase [Terriglobales bacterium]|nr:prephenate dehydratase [Terriglobales bacterium]